MKGSLSHKRTPSVRYGADTVEYVTEVKYLGLTVRGRINFNYHLQSVKEKLSKSVEAVKRVLRVDYGFGKRLFASYLKDCLHHVFFIYLFNKTENLQIF